MQQKVIFVNATSLGTKGGLTILNQYISGLEHKLENTEKYFIFAPDNIEANTQNGDICIIKNGENEFYINRDYWNAIGMKKWSKNHGLKPHKLFSMQNYYPFGFTDKSIIKELYVHQALPFYDYDFSTLKKLINKAWFYKYIYFFLIKKSVRESDIVFVQTEWLKKRLVEKCHVSPDKIVVKRPNFPDIDPANYNAINNLRGKINLFYPAGGVGYKNHVVLYKAMNVIINKKSRKDIVLYLTLEESNKEARKYINKFNLHDNIVLLGHLDYDVVMRYYKSVDVLLFPSKIESFGLPLVEAQYFNLPIIVSDLDIYREVIGGYKGEVVYCDSDDEREWAKNIML